MVRLSKEQWERIWEYFPEENIPAGRAGRKPMDTRRVLEAVLSILIREPSGNAAAVLSELQDGTSVLSAWARHEAR